MPTTSVVLFTRDLRLHDNPALVAAADADRLVALFVLDDAILSSRYATPNRLTHLLAALEELRRGLRERGSELIVRRGKVVEVVRDVLSDVDATELHLASDVSDYAQARQRRLVDAADGVGARVEAHPGVTLVDAAGIQPSSGGPFKVFTPYYNRWREAHHRAVISIPDRLPRPPGPSDLSDGVETSRSGTSRSGSTAPGRSAALEPGEIPALDELVDGVPAPDLPAAGESAALERLAWWLDGPIEDYGDGHDDLAVDGTSRLSHHLHLGTLSIAQVVAQLDLRRRGHEPFLRQLCWREFNHQLLAAKPDLTHEDIRTQHDRWHDDDQAFEAWAEGRTGYPLVDAGMRQLRREGWMHNRARLVTASFLTKHLRVDWRRGAWHFMDHLVDGDIANNFSQWQWVAGTGTDSRPNRIFNPIAQAERYDPSGAYVRRYVPELAEVEDAMIHRPWETEPTLLGDGAHDYPAPIVDHAEARERFLEERGRR